MEYIQDFHHLASHLGDWPESLLVYHFQVGMNKELYQNCLPWGEGAVQPVSLIPCDHRGTDQPDGIP